VYNRQVGSSWGLEQKEGSPSVTDQCDARPDVRASMTTIMHHLVACAPRRFIILLILLGLTCDALAQSAQHKTTPTPHQHADLLLNLCLEVFGTSIRRYTFLKAPE